MSTLPPPVDERRGAIVLVHGAWVGEWSWSPVLPILRRTGRPVHAVSLAGHGVRRRESGPHITLSDHVADAVGVIETFDLVDVTLVGHSYGGRVITRVYDELADRIAHLVYLDAHAPLAPDSGQSPERAAIAAAHGGMIPFTGYDPDPAEVGGAAGVRWFLDRVVDQSFATFTVPISGDLPPSLRTTYVFSTGNRPSLFEGYAAAARDSPDWEYHELPGSHWLMFAHPDEVADIIAGRPPEQAT